MTDDEIDQTYSQQISGTQSLADIQGLRTQRPWRESRSARLLDNIAGLREQILRQREQILERDATIQANNALKVGTFYARIDQVFTSGDNLPAVDITFYKRCCRPTSEERVRQLEEERRQQQNNARSRRQLMRTSGPSVVRAPQQPQQQHKSNYFCRTGRQDNPVIDPYADTYKAAKEGGRRPPATKEGQSRTGTHASRRFEIWKNVAVGSPPIGEIAHLVPAAPTKAETYWFVAEFLFGIDNSRTTVEVLRLINGSTDANGDKVANTGIKHFVTNKVLLAAQRDYYDHAPCVIIVPILSREAAVNWRGEGYDAIMMIDSYDGPKNTLESVCALTWFNHDFGETASHDDLALSVGLVRTYTSAIMYAQRERKPKEIAFKPSEEGWVTTFYARDWNRGNPLLRVRKIKFESNSSTTGHPAPDPLLLVTKAIAVLQQRHGFNIVAKAEPAEASDDRSERSIMAEEDYLRRRDESQEYMNPIGMDVVISHSQDIQV